jgi:TolA-binding protein
MTASRLVTVLALALSALWLLADSAAARSSSSSHRSSRSSNDRSGSDYGGRHRVIEDIDQEEAQKKKEEEAKKQTEERKQKEDEKQKAAEEKKHQAEEKKKALQAKLKERTAPKATATAKKTDKPASLAKKTDAADEQKATQLLTQAGEKFEAGELMPGVVLLRQVIEEGGGTAAAEEARRWLDYLLSLEQHGPVILLADAEDAFNAQRYRKAQNLYSSLIEKFPKGEQSDAARKRLAEIEAGDLLSKTAYTKEELEDARLWLLAGNIHLENGRRDEALAAYRRAIEDYPGCPYAQQAAAKVAELQQKVAVANP